MHNAAAAAAVTQRYHSSTAEACGVARAAEHDAWPRAGRKRGGLRSCAKPLLLLPCQLLRPLFLAPLSVSALHVSCGDVFRAFLGITSSVASGTQDISAELRWLLRRGLSPFFA